MKECHVAAIFVWSSNSDETGNSDGRRSQHSEAMLYLAFCILYSVGRGSYSGRYIPPLSQKVDWSVSFDENGEWFVWNQMAVLLLLFTMSKGLNSWIPLCVWWLLVSCHDQSLHSRQVLMNQQPTWLCLLFDSCLSMLLEALACSHDHPGSLPVCLPCGYVNGLKYCIADFSVIIVSSKIRHWHFRFKYWHRYFSAVQERKERIGSSRIGFSIHLINVKRILCLRHVLKVKVCNTNDDWELCKFITSFCALRRFLSCVLLLIEAGCLVRSFDQPAGGCLDQRIVRSFGIMMYQNPKGQQGGLFVQLFGCINVQCVSIIAITFWFLYTVTFLSW